MCLVLIEARRGGRPGLSYEPDFIEFHPDGTETDELPFELEGVTPIYKEMKGWKTDMTQYTSEDQFPQEFKDYIRFLEDFLETRIGIISIGPDREQTIVRG